MKYRDLRDFIARLERLGELKRVAAEIDPRLEMTEICDRVLKAGGPAVLFERPKGHTIPVLGNLFGTTRRVALALGVDPGSLLAGPAARTRWPRCGTSASFSHSSRSPSRRRASRT